MKNSVRKSIVKWILAVLFWVAFGVSIALDGRFPWIRTLWVALLLLTMLALSIYYVFHMRRDEDGVLRLGGYPRWYRRFFFDE